VRSRPSLAANFPQFINVLANLEGGLPNVHIGVVSSDMGGARRARPGDGGCAGLGDNGALQARAACNVSGLFLSTTSTTAAAGAPSTTARGSLAQRVLVHRGPRHRGLRLRAAPRGDEARA
jgi:hypothetical protein